MKPDDEQERQFSLRHLRAGMGEAWEAGHQSTRSQLLCRTQGFFLESGHPEKQRSRSICAQASIVQNFGHVHREAKEEETTTADPLADFSLFLS